jgi:putative hydrolase of the HAD superfamily
MSTSSAQRTGIDWPNIDAVIFDVDGTLFDHLALRPAIATALIRHALTRRRGWRDLYVVWKFRRLRTRLALAEAERIGQQDFEVTSQATGVPISDVKQIVTRWLFQEPLSIIRRHAFSGADEFLARLKERGIRTGVFSDYPADDKLKVLGLKMDFIRDASSTEIARLKPNPAGFLKVAELLGVTPSRCVIIGDRDDRDGQAAKRGGFLFLKKIPGKRRPASREFNSYQTLADELREIPAKSSDYDAAVRG